MDAQTWEMLDREFEMFPIMRAADVPDDDEIAEAAALISCTLHDDYVEFLRRIGGAMVGSLPVFGLRPAEVMGNQWSVAGQTKWYRDQGWPGCEEWYIISEDGFGNPIGIRPDGKVMISDHDVGEISVLADSFEEFLVKHCSKRV